MSEGEAPNAWDLKDKSKNQVLKLRFSVGEYMKV
jgi:hypothetical protein